MATPFIWKINNTIARLSMRKLARGAHLTRFFMYDRLRRIGDELPAKQGDVLSISHSTRLGDIIGISPTTVTEANYPEMNMLSLPYSDESFDFVFSDQVLEHIEGNPQVAVNESWRVLRSGGIALHTTCFINPVHGSPCDFWRFTPDALKLLCARFSRIIDYGGWGNFDASVLIRRGMRFDGVPLAVWHPLHRIAVKNEPEWPIVTWIVAQK